MPDMSDVKIFVLYLMKNIPAPLDFQTLSEIIVFDGSVSYFDFATAFAFLLERGAIAELKENDSDKYIITPLGADIVDNTEERLLNMVKENAVKSALRLLAHKKNGNTITSEVLEEDGGYYFHALIRDNEKTSFELKLFLFDRYEADKMKVIFEKKAEIILRGIFSLLSGDAKFILETMD